MKNILSCKIENVYVACISPDDRRSVIFGYYDSYEKAKESVKGQSWYGSDGTVSLTPLEALTITFDDGSKSSFLVNNAFEIQHETLYEKDVRLKEARKTALKKLTDSEKEALGLK